MSFGRIFNVAAGAFFAGAMVYSTFIADHAIPPSQSLVWFGLFAAFWAAADLRFSKAFKDSEY